MPALPDLSFAALSELIRTRPLKSKLGSATYVRMVLETDDLVRVVHYDSVIAEIGLDTVRLDNRGRHSRGTGYRMDRVLRDNGYTHRIGIRQGSMCLLDEDGRIVHRGMRTATLTRTPHGVMVSCT